MLGELVMWCVLWHFGSWVGVSTLKTAFVLVYFMCLKVMSWALALSCQPAFPLKAEFMLRHLEWFQVMSWALALSCQLSSFYVMISL